METKIKISDELVMNQIYIIRGHKVMLDSDLAELYGAETKQLKRLVKRNAEPFPEDFMFEQYGGTENFKEPIWHLKTRGALQI